MTERQTRFVAEYLVDLNATQAAKRAGFSKKTAGQIGARLLKDVKIHAEIVKAQGARADRTQITADRVLKELALIGFSDMRQFSEWGASGVTLLDSNTLEEDAARCVSEVSQTISAEGGSIKFKLHDKPAALLTIGRHLGMFTDRLSVVVTPGTGVLAVPVLNAVSWAQTAITQQAELAARVPVIDPATAS